MEKFDRLRIARVAAGHESAADAARAIGAKVSSYTHHENGTREFTDKHALFYGRRFKADPCWLLFGVGEGPKGVARAQVAAEDAREISVLSWVAAGQMSEAMIPDPDGTQKLTVGGLGAGSFFGLTVSGDSMNRVSPEGSIVIVDANDRELQAGQPYIFSIRGDATYKRWQPSPPRLEPDSWLPHDTIFLDGTNTMFVVGRVKRTMLDL
ncbi:putative bacteriophage-related transcriptional repressor [Stappia sp. 22II-S9-Z10]|nr:putative bacteriophage-related transcriptional repressor [Stappia sp. 22II-S9-Z10]